MGLSLYEKFIIQNAPTGSKLLTKVCDEIYEKKHCRNCGSSIGCNSEYCSECGMLSGWKQIDT